MSNLDENIIIKCDSLFQNKIRNNLIETSSRFSSIKTNQSNNPFENQKDKLKAMQLVLEKLTNELVKIGNIALSEFEKEITNVHEPVKGQALDRMKNLITSVIQELVKKQTVDKFHE